MIPTKIVIFGLLAIILYLYLADKFSKASFSQYAQNVVSNSFGNTTTHTAIIMMAHYGNLFAGFISASALSIAACLPRIVQHPINMTMGAVVAVGLGWFKWGLNYISLGFYNINGTNSTNITNSTIVN